MKLSTIEKIKFVVLIVIFITINVIFNSPYYSNLIKIKNKFKNESTTLAQIFANIMDESKSIDEFNNIKNQLISYDEALLKHGEELELIQSLETLAAKNSLRQEISMDQTEREINEQVYELDIRLSLNGNFYNLLNYLNDLQDYEYKLTIKYLDINGSPPDLGLTLLTSSYWQYE